MSFVCGFFNSINGDRKYNAEEMNNPYSRIVSNGVFAKPDGKPSNDFQVVSVSGMTVKVSVGEGIFAGKWGKLDADMHFEILNAHVTLKRIDSIIIRIDNSSEVRAGSIVYRQGTPATNAVPPALESTEYIKEYRLANITVAANATAITQANITDTRAGSDCGFITHLLQQADITATYAQWQAQFDEWNSEKHSEFDEWEQLNKTNFETWEQQNKANFEEWFATVKETLSTATLIRSYTSAYTTTTQDEKVIPIQITQFNWSLDILQVFVNGLRLLPDIEYTVNGNELITLAKPVDKNTPVAFVVYKSVDGSEAESVVQQVYALQQVQVTANGGGAKYSLTAGQNILDYFKTLPAGVHTLYAPSGTLGLPVSGFAFRFIGHLTVSRGETSIGWLMAYKSDGKIYANYLDTGTWKGWKEITNSTQITADNGGAQIEVTDTSSVLTAFVNAGIGFHTMYSATGATDTPVNGAFRYFGHITGETTGYIFAMSSAGSVYSNYRNGGVWQGWKVLFEKNQTPLWEGAYFMNENQTVTPSKPLDQCQHGWVLVWSDYDDATSTKNNYNAVTFCVPKKNASGANWNGSSFMCCLPREVKTDGSFVITAKQVYIYNDKITGFAANNANPANRDVILSAIYEY